MPEFTRLTSRQHDIVKRFRLAAKRRTDDSVLLDGDHLLADAIEAGVKIDVAIVTSAHRALAVRARRAGATVYDATDAVIEAASPVRTPSGVVALAHWTPATIDRALGEAGALVVGLVNVQDPGNVGSAIRSADALGATGVVAIDGTAHPGGWKALRGAMGSTFRVPVAVAGINETLAAAVRYGLQVAASVARDGRPAHEADLSKPTLLLLGGEGAGLDPSLVGRADVRVTIPMRSNIDSLNVSATAALLLYEARRQRSS